MVQGSRSVGFRVGYGVEVFGFGDFGRGFGAEG